MALTELTYTDPAAGADGARRVVTVGRTYDLDGYEVTVTAITGHSLWGVPLVVGDDTDGCDLSEYGDHEDGEGWLLLASDLGVEI